MNSSINGSQTGSSISDITSGSDSSAPLATPGLIHFPNPIDLDRRYNGVNGYLSSTRLPNPRCHTTMRRSRHFVPNECKDEYYWQKRLKNNEAARKSRQKRRTIDSVLEEKVLSLSHENQLLRYELYAMKVKYGELRQNGDHAKKRTPTSSEDDGSNDCDNFAKVSTNNNRCLGYINSPKTPRSDSLNYTASAAEQQSLRLSLAKSLTKNVESDGSSGGGRQHASSGINDQMERLSSCSSGNQLLSHLACGNYVLGNLSSSGTSMQTSSIADSDFCERRRHHHHLHPDEKSAEAAATLATLLKQNVAKKASSSSQDSSCCPSSGSSDDGSSSSSLGSGSSGYGDGGSAPSSGSGSAAGNVVKLNLPHKLRHKLSPVFQTEQDTKSFSSPI